MKFLDREEIDRNTLRQASKILKFIGESYDLGLFEDPDASYRVCGLLALICEGRVEGTIDPDKEVVKWSLTREYEEEIQKKLDQITSESKNVIQGPW